jgi:hypothetical protein
MNSTGIHILGLGSEAKGLLRNSPNGSIVRTCPFPIDSDTMATFLEIAKSLIDENIFYDANIMNNLS